MNNLRSNLRRLLIVILLTPAAIALSVSVFMVGVMFCTEVSWAEFGTIVIIIMTMIGLYMITTEYWGE